MIAADDALSAAELGPWSRKYEIDQKFGKAINLLSDFAKDFALENLMSDLNIGGNDTGEVKMGDKSKSATTILRALKDNLYSNVKFPPVSITLNANGTLANGP